MTGENISLHKPLLAPKATDRTSQKMVKPRNGKSDLVLQRLRMASAFLAHVIAFSFPIYIATLAQPGSSLFSWHPTLMALAFSLIMLEAIMVFSPECSLLFAASRKTKVRVHWLLQSCCVIFALSGFGVIVYNKVRAGKSHFQSWHGVFGLITTIYILIQSSGGVVLLYPQIAKNWKLVQLKTYHATFGLLGFVLACTTLVLGLYSRWFIGKVSGSMWYISVFCIGWLAFVIMNQVTIAYLPKVKSSASL